MSKEITEVHIFDGMEHGQIYNQCLQKQREWNESMGGDRKRAEKNLSGCTQWQHLSDAVEKGTVSPMEAYDALELGFVPENLKIRDSKYSRLL